MPKQMLPYFQFFQLIFLFSRNILYPSNTLSLSVIVGPLWKTFESSLRVYVRSSIEGTEDSYEGRYDSDGAEKSLDSFVIQVIILMAQ